MFDLSISVFTPNYSRLLWEIDGVAHSLMILQKKIYVIPRVAHSSNVFYDMILMTAVNLVTGV